MKEIRNYSNAQITWLVILRIFIGWHFMYEGLVKILNPKWTSLPYLLDSKGPISSFFINLTQNDSVMTIVNFLNEWSLFCIGFCLILGLFSKLASIGGMILLLTYSLSHPALLDVSYMMPFEGSYLWIDKNLVEFAALGVLCAFSTSKIIGLDRLLVKILPTGFLKLKLI
ncbi:DoxX family membrane protein [Massilibacteroides sp.]|uniref:DoxX family membrane protein n=1 Tax=Massilibacteroides sp. TaxID=2034766 RepID=UPI00263602DA|nr:DoxX family membrane protein [Massilibacteroides sp.]MDD4514170.1 DoxX family membrane protein [Massilibacteroides sp.]